MGPSPADSLRLLDLSPGGRTRRAYPLEDGGNLRLHPPPPPRPPDPARHRVRRPEAASPGEPVPSRGVPPRPEASVLARGRRPPHFRRLGEPRGPAPGLAPALPRFVRSFRLPASDAETLIDSNEEVENGDCLSLRDGPAGQPRGTARPASAGRRSSGATTLPPPRRAALSRRRARPDDGADRRTDLAPSRAGEGRVRELRAPL